MVFWTSKDVIKDWIDYLENSILPENFDKEPGPNHKSIILDSILAFNYLINLDDKIVITDDQRLLKLLDICESGYPEDWYHRFLRYNPKINFDNKNLWWLKCWESIRLNNILHKINYRDIDEYLQESISGGQEFSEKWEQFFNYANASKYEANSLPAFSYLECCLFALNIGKDFSTEELERFLLDLCARNGDSLKVFQKSIEIRVKALSILEVINSNKIEHYEYINKQLLSIIKQFVVSSNWDKYSHSLATCLFEINNPEIIDLIKEKIYENKTIDSQWITGGVNYKRKPRFALLLAINEIGKVDYFDLIEPNNFLYSSRKDCNYYIEISKIIDNIIQSFDSNSELKRKMQDEDKIHEEYFQDLLKTGLSGTVGNFTEWVEKEKETGSGRISDVYAYIKDGPNIPIETKILWRFQKEESYNPIDEALEQTCQWDFGITLVINPKSNPLYKKTYRGFEGWKNWVKNHDSFIPGTIQESDKYFSSAIHFKTNHFFSSHRLKGAGREKNINLLNFYIDTKNYITSPSLKKT